MREKYESLSLATLKDLAKARGLKGVSALRKPELIERMLHEDELEGETKKQETVREKPQQSEVEGNGERIPQYNKTPERTQYHAPAEAVQLDSGERADGILEVLPDGALLDTGLFGYLFGKGGAVRHGAQYRVVVCGFA